MDSKYDKTLLILELNIFHFEISGKEIKEEQLKNNLCKSITLLKFHLEISGNSFNDEHPQNNPEILLTLILLMMNIQKIILRYY